VDVSRALRVGRDRADRYVLKSAGDNVQANEVIAAHGGLLGRLRAGCRSPVDGQVIEVRNGLILIAAAESTFELAAHIKGQVTNVMPSRGVVISAAGALIQGVWGSGGEADGVLKLVVENPQRPIRARSIDVSCQGTIVVGGRILDENTLEQAVEARVRGIVAGSVDANLIPFLQALPFPILITEGFGNLSISEPAFGLLHSNMGREAMLNADIQTRWGARRPEVLIPLRADDAAPPDSPAPRALEVGDLVRVARPPHLGTLGTVVALPKLPQPTESGDRLPSALVEMDGAEEPVAIPLANLEIIH
jgi:hypothetical protein